MSYGPKNNDAFFTYLLALLRELDPRLRNRHILSFALNADKIEAFQQGRCAVSRSGLGVGWVLPRRSARLALAQ